MKKRAEEIKLRLLENKEKFRKLQSKFRQPAHIQHVLLDAFRPKNKNEIEVVCDHASEQARAIIEQDSRSSPRRDRFNRPVDALGLCEEEICAIQMYTQSEIIYKPFNAATRANQAAQYKAYHDILLSAHQKMPLDPQMRLLHRGVAEELQGLYPPQKQFTWKDFTSWSTNQETAAEFARRDDGGRSTMFCVHSNMGKCVKKYSEFKKEEEFLLPPNMTFVVKAHDQYTTLTGERHTLIVLEHHSWSTSSHT